MIGCPKIVISLNKPANNMRCKNPHNRQNTLRKTVISERGLNKNSQVKIHRRSQQQQNNDATEKRQHYLTPDAVPGHHGD